MILAHIRIAKAISISLALVCAASLHAQSAPAPSAETNTAQKTMPRPGEPSPEQRKKFDELITQCGMKPEDISIYYVWTCGQAVQADVNALKIDPLIWKGIENDPEFEKARYWIAVDGLEIKNLSGNVFKKLYTQIYDVLTLEAQNFMFKHELAHVFYNHEKKRLLKNFSILGIGFSTAYGVYVSGFNKWLALWTGWASMELLGSINKRFFHSYEEWLADKFAIKYSSVEEIKAAADFFEKRAKIMRKHERLHPFYVFVWRIFSLCDINDIARARMLRKAAAQKEAAQVKNN